MKVWLHIKGECEQVFDNTPAAKDGTLESGDELVGVNGTNVKVSTTIFLKILFFFNIIASYIVHACAGEN